MNDSSTGSTSHDNTPEELPPIWLTGAMMGEHDKPDEPLSIGLAPRDSKTFAIQFLATVAAMRGESVVFVNPKPTPPEIVPSPT